nr:VOC family protein [Streptomyces sp. NRRL S-1521]
MPSWSTHSSPARASDTAPTRQDYRLTGACDIAQPGLTKSAHRGQRLPDSSPKAPDLLGINHLTLSTADLDRLVAFSTEVLGASLAFERPATASDPRIAVLDVGGNDHLMIVEAAATPAADLDPLGRAGWGLRVGTYVQLREVREQIQASGCPVGQIETLPTQWTMTARDPDGRPGDVRAHRPRTAPPSATMG